MEEARRRGGVFEDEVAEFGGQTGELGVEGGPRAVLL